MSITNIYGPNKDDTECFAGIHKMVEDSDSGDFNIVLSNNLDKIGSKPEHSQTNPVCTHMDGRM